MSMKVKNIHKGNNTAINKNIKRKIKIRRFKKPKPTLTLLELVEMIKGFSDEDFNLVFAWITSLRKKD